MRRIVVGYDGSEAARHALERVAALARNGAEVVVVNVRPLRAPAPLPLADDDIVAQRRKLDEAHELLATRRVRSRRVERHGGAAEMLVEQAKESGADLMVVGSHGKNLAERLVLGSVSRKVLHHAPCDVLVVR
ncbi:MAG: universal stress protein [Gaiellaceae bacterium]